MQRGENDFKTKLKHPEYFKLFLKLCQAGNV
jgi:hypothetical protein